MKTYIAAAIFVLWAAAAGGQVEVAMGGGFHAGLRVGDIEQPASLPTLDARAVGWLGDRWGVAGRLLAGIGEPTYEEQPRPTYIQVLAQFRSKRTETIEWRFGFGGGLMRWKEVWGPHLLAVETFVAARLTDRVGLRVGASAVVPISVHPVALISYQF